MRTAHSLEDAVSAVRMIATSLPPNMVAKIDFAPCPIEGLNGDCWDWTGAISSSGYGSVGYQSKVYSSHRLAYMLLVGEIPNGLQLDHLCMRKTCCNPAHLEPVTNKVNCSRTAAATKPRCANGHPLAGPNLRLKKTTRGGIQRECRTCCHEMKTRLAVQRGQAPEPAPAVMRRRTEMLAASEAALSMGISA